MNYEILKNYTELNLKFELFTLQNVFIAYFAIF